MSESYRALCNDFYVNQKVQVKLDLPRGRDTVLELFERIRRQFPEMGQFRRFKDELALESSQSNMPHRWLAVRANTIRSGVVNADNAEDGYKLHRVVLDAAPAYLNVSPLDVEYVELLFGFDLLAAGNHDQIVHDALYANSPLACLIDTPDARVSDCQPLVGLAIGGERELEVYFEVKTRGRSPRTGGDDSDPGEPISVYLTVRKFGAPADPRDLPNVLQSLAHVGEELVESKVAPRLLAPLRDAIASAG